MHICLLRVPFGFATESLYKNTPVDLLRGIFFLSLSPLKIEKYVV